MTNATNDSFTFNLISEDWIRCRMCDDAGRETRLMSLEDVFRQAHEIQEIVGDNPLVTITLHRLLIVILHRTLNLHDWRKTWNSKRFDMNLVEEYLRDETIYSRFDLFDAKRPFYQSLEVPEPRTGDEPENAKRKHPDIDSAAKLLFHMDENPTLFAHHLVHDPPELSPALAARLLIAFQSFHFRGTIGTEGKKGQITASDSPLTNCAIGLARGRNLFETLMLNFYGRDKEPFNELHDRASDDKPVWERDEDVVPLRAKPGEKARIVLGAPTGYLDLLTWQSRRIRLKPTKSNKGETVVRHARIWDGLTLNRDYPRQATETMIGFRKNLKPKSVKGSHEETSSSGWSQMYIRQDRALWRDSYSLFHSYTDKRTSEERERPMMLDWLQRLANPKDGVLQSSREVPMDFFSALAEQGKLVWWRHERLPLPLRYLTNDADGSLSGELNKALKLSESVATTLKEGVRRLTVLLLIPYCDSKNLDYFRPRTQFKPAETRKARRESAKKNQTVIERKIREDKPAEINERVQSFAPELRYWSRLENEFRQMIIGLAKARGDAETPPEGFWQAETQSDWAKALKRVAQQAFDEIVGGIGANARNLRAAAIAAAWFNAELASQSYKPSKRDRDESDSSDTGEADDANAGGDDE